MITGATSQQLQAQPRTASAFRPPHSSAFFRPPCAPCSRSLQSHKACALCAPFPPPPMAGPSHAGGERPRVGQGGHPLLRLPCPARRVRAPARAVAAAGGRLGRAGAAAGMGRPGACLAQGRAWLQHGVCVPYGRKCCAAGFPAVLASADCTFFETSQPAEAC